MHPEHCELTLRLDADYADIFEVRGVVREERGRRLPSVLGEEEIVLAYEGLDGRVRRSRVRFSEPGRPLDRR